MIISFSRAEDSLPMAVTSFPFPGVHIKKKKKKLVLREWINQRWTCHLEYLKHQSVVLIKHLAGKSQESWTQKYAILALELQMPCSGHLCFPEGLSASKSTVFLLFSYSWIQWLSLPKRNSVLGRLEIQPTCLHLKEVFKGEKMGNKLIPNIFDEFRK